MADLKEETTLDNNNDSNEVEETVETKKPIDPSLDGIQLFYEKNKKMVTYVGGGLLAIIAAFVFYKFYYLPDQEKLAADEIFWAEKFFEKDSFNLALRGGVDVMTADGPKQTLGFEKIAEEYSLTKAGALANYYAGICYMRTGKFEEAITYLSKYNGSDEIVAPISYGAIGDCHMELNRTDEALKFYLKAANESQNSFTAPFYLQKAGLAYELKSDFAGALSVYERIQKEFPKSNEASEIEKHIAKVKAMGNL